MIYILLVLLLIKHTIVDFCWQTDIEIANKGTYGNIFGIGHSGKHWFFTHLILSGAFIYELCTYWNSRIDITLTRILIPIFALSLLDGVIHYHIDYIKKRFGNPDPLQKQHWRHFGYDQLAHLLTYVLIVYLVMLWR